MKFCDLEKCNAPTFTLWQYALYSLLTRFTNISPYYSASFTTLKDIFLKKLVIDEKPRHLNYSLDLSCNLKCPSCRSDYIQNDPNLNVDQTVKDFELIASSAETILFSGGEVFFSKRNLSIIKSITPKKYPRLKSITVMTNGLNLNEFMWANLGVSKSYIKRVLVSIDAGNEETYKLVRGGNWNTLISNLEFIRELRRSKQIDFFSIQFVPRLDNYESMIDFINLGNIYEVDRIHFQTFCQWPDSPLNFNEQAIHLNRHPFYPKFLSLSKIVKANQKVLWAIE
jgi:MoaA/NifB/PqqE/SkfB family radical SAM enzyme